MSRDQKLNRKEIGELVAKLLSFDKQIGISEGCLIHPHCNGPYYPCYDPCGPSGFKNGIQSVKGRLRSVNCVSLVGLGIFSWQEWSYTVCRSVRTVRITKVIYSP